jgi:hypothetical protein
MKGILKIFWFFLNFQRLMTWMLYINLFVLIVIVPITAYFLDSVAAWGILTASVLMIFILSVATSPWAFRLLIANQRLSQVPDFNIRAGIALLLLLIVSISIPTFITYTLWGRDYSLLRLLNIFSAASLYIGIVQLCSGSLRALRIMPFIPIIAIFGARFNLEFIRIILSDTTFILTFFTLSLAGWCYGFYMLTTQSAFKALPTSGLQWDSSANQQITGGGGNLSWLSKLNFNGVHNKVDSILISYLDGTFSKISRCILIAVISPLCWMLLIFLMVIGETRENGPSFDAWPIFMYFSIFTIIISALGYGELSARARYLWLRLSGNREIIWKHLEKIVMLNMLIYTVIIAILCIVMMTFSSLPGATVSNFFIIATCSYIYASYLSLFARVKSWPNMLLILAILGSIFFVLMNFFMAQDNSIYYAFLNGVLLALGFILRFATKQKYKTINWMIVKPVQQNRIASQQ